MPKAMRTGRRFQKVSKDTARYFQKVKPVSAQKAKHTSRYFHYDEGTGRWRNVDRPGNQSLPSVQRNVAERIAERWPSSLRPHVTRRFLVEFAEGKSLSAMGIDMAHNISAKELGTLIAEYMNDAESRYEKRTGKRAPSYSLEEFAMDIVTTDAEKEDEEEIRDHVRNIVNMKLPRSVRAASADWLLTRMNRTRGNLAPGVASFNRSLGQNQDQPLTTDGRPLPFVAKRTDAAIQANAALGTSRDRYGPRLDQWGEAISSTR